MTSSVSDHFAQRTLRLAAACAALFAASATLAADFAPSGFYVQAGAAEQGVTTLAVGVTWPWAAKWDVWGTQIGGYWEATAAHWRARDTVGNQSFTQLAFVPMFRVRFDQGRSPWFAEAGIGLTVNDKRYITPHKTFGSSWNFSDNIAVGRSFGVANDKEVSLRVNHLSNAGIKKPNPGENFLQLRYAQAF